MDGTWSLDALYLGFDDPKYLADREKLSRLCAEFNTLAGKLGSLPAGEALHQALCLQEELTETSTLLRSYASLRQSTNARDGEAVSHLGQLQAQMGAVAGASAAVLHIDV